MGHYIARRLILATVAGCNLREDAPLQHNARV